MAVVGCLIWRSGRVTTRYSGYDTDETAYGDADDVTGDTILQQSVTTYDASGHVIQTTRYARKHTASGTGALTSSTARDEGTTKEQRLTPFWQSAQWQKLPILSKRSQT